MAIGFVGGNTGSAAGSTGTTFDISLTALTGGSGSAAQEGDIVIVAVTVGASGNTVSIGPVTGGYTELVDLWGDDVIDANLTVSWKVMGATPDTVITIDPSGDATFAISAVVHVWRGVSTVSPFDVAGVSVTGINGGRPDPGAITPLAEGAVVVVAGGASGSFVEFTSTDLDNFFTIGASDSYSCVSGMGSYAWTSGAFDPAAWGGSTTNTSSANAAYTMALRPVSLPITPGSATLSITTNAPAVSAFVDPGVASVSISAHAPSLFVDEGSRILSPGQAAIIVAAAEPSSAIGLWSHPAEASASVLGSAPTLEVTDHHTTSADTGVLMVSGLAPLSQVAEVTIVSPAVGALSISLETPNAVQNEITSPAPASLTTTSSQVSLQRLFASTPDPDALAITGAAPSLLESVATVMQPAVAALAITGQAPVVDLGAVPIPSSTTLTASGVAPALRLDMVCSPGVGSLLTNWLVTADSTDTVDGEWTADGIVIQTAPTVVVSDHAIAQPGAGSATVTGQAPTVAVTTGVWSEPSAGSIAITGQQPTVAQTTSQYPSPNPCTITVDCIEPTPVVGTVIGVPVATVAITSSAPSLVADTNVVISGETPVIGVAGPGNMVMSVIRLYGALDGGRDVRLKWPEN